MASGRRFSGIANSLAHPSTDEVNNILGPEKGPKESSKKELKWRLSQVGFLGSSAQRNFLLD